MREQEQEIGPDQTEMTQNPALSHSKRVAVVALGVLGLTLGIFAAATFAHLSTFAHYQFSETKSATAGWMTASLVWSLATVVAAGWALGEEKNRRDRR